MLTILQMNLSSVLSAFPALEIICEAILGETEYLFGEAK